MSVVEEPKKALSAFFNYLQDNRATFMKELGENGKARGAVSSYGSKKWNSLSAEQKKPYEQKTADGKAAYEKAMVEFKAQGGQVGLRRAEKRERKGLSKRERKAGREMAGKPKKPAGGAFGCYMNEHRSSIQNSLPAGTPCTGTMKIGSERWKKISPEEKEKFEKLYLEKKAKYEEAMKEWKEKLPEEAEEADEDDEEDGEKDGEEDEVLAVPSPSKRPRLSASPSKAKKEGGEEALAEAKKEGLLAKLKAMMENPKIASMGAQTLLDALRKAGGKVPEAKRALLGK